MSIFKVFIAGPEGAGKTELIKTISDFPLVSIEKKIPTTDVILPMDYGRIRIDSNMLFLYSAPNSSQIMGLWRILCTEMHGCLIVVDSANRAASRTAHRSIGIYSRRPRFLGWSQSVPHVVVANKVDLDGAASLQELQRSLRLPRSSVILPCVGTQRSSVMMVITELMRMLQE